MLPNHLFINLINTDLQKRIANAKDLDFDTTNIIKTLIETGPTQLCNDMED